MTSIFESGLKPDINNANEGTQRGRGLLEKSLRQLGAGRSILADKDGNVIAGNKTLESAADIDLPVRIVETDGHELVVVKRTDLDLYSETDKRARQLAYADNKIAEVDLAWKPEQIQVDFKPLELGEWGFDDPNPSGGADAEPQIDRAAELNEKWQVKTGDLWKIGEHRLLCGDSMIKADVDKLMGDETADIVTDPPYGMKLNADYSSLTSSKSFGKGKCHESVIGDDKPFDASAVFGCDGKEQFWFGADYYAKTLGDTENTGAWLVWDKRITESADLMYGSCFELIWSKQKHKRDILRHKWAGFFTDGEERDFIHPTTKPVSLIIDLINLCKEDIIYDPFLGSGTTMVACENLSRKCRGIEISQNYCAVILERMATAFPELTIERIAIQ